MRNDHFLIGLTSFTFLMAATACSNDDSNVTSEEQQNVSEVSDSEPTETEEDLNKVEDDEMVDEDTEERELELVEEGEEREASTTKEDYYMQNGTFVGGEITDGRSVGDINQGAHDGYERLVLDIYEGSYQELGDPADIPNYFEITKEAYPSRLIYTLAGIRGLPEEIPELSNMELFSHMSVVPYFSDATIQLAVYLQEPVEFEVFEMHNPAKIVTDIRSISDENEYAPVFSVRTASTSQGDTVDAIQSADSEFRERDADQVRTLHSEDNSVFVEEGYYSSLEEAEERKIELENDGIDFDLHIEERGTHDIPKYIK
ncbi:hypothetical protein [Alkalicoccobacillus plakortidis]|uniref:Sporulation related protein n=1 Tax=Alkalicoccobacillus plakortidis TaxID=444060 RepID=A0ABT0XPU8_9BACI|nr:hypothetical protein [Alkalicoccobacillus plakortidis]MCM2677930.1 hypothetical protein [Alkalicoccobacillus plakortidis]